MKISELLTNCKLNGFNPIVHSLITGLNNLTNNPYIDDSTSTEEVKTCLCEIGRKKNYYVCASDVSNSDHGEWLYDVTWLEYVGDDPQNSLVKIPFVAECEWGDTGDIKDDFDKLVQSTADVRLLIFDGTKHNAKKKVKDLSSLVNRYNYNLVYQKTLYLFSSWEWTNLQNNTWHFRHLIFNPKLNKIYLVS